MSVRHTATAEACVTNPIRLNLSSPFEARATPAEIINTITASLRFGSAIRNVHEMMRIATGVKAYG